MPVARVISWLLCCVCRMFHVRSILRAPKVSLRVNRHSNVKTRRCVQILARHHRPESFLEWRKSTYKTTSSFFFVHSSMNGNNERRTRAWGRFSSLRWCVVSDWPRDSDDDGHHGQMHLQFEGWAPEFQALWQRTEQKQEKRKKLEIILFHDWWHTLEMKKNPSAVHGAA